MDVVIKCNEILLQTIRLAGGAPGPISRTGAMMHLTVYDIINSLTVPAPPHAAYLASLPAPGANVRRNLAALFGAQKVLSEVYNDAAVVASASTRDAVQDAIEEAFTVLFGDLSFTPAEEADSKAYGEGVADLMIAERATDNHDAPMTYTPSTDPGQWRPTNAAPAATPQWGQVTPFGRWTPDDKFRAPRPAGYATRSAMLASREYAEQVNEVKQLGDKNSTFRTSEQTEIGFFWANDLDGTSKPPGQLFTLTSIVSNDRGLSLEENARLFALVAAAMADAAIVAWDTKYDTTIDLWRPETAIRQAHLDGNANTVPDSDWEPLSQTAPEVSMDCMHGHVMPTHFSPPFPAYISGHATFAAAHAAVMRNYFGTDNVSFTLTTEDPNAVGVERSFNSFNAAALENARSRIYLGVHFQWDGDHGYLSGTSVGDYVFSNILV